MTTNIFRSLVGLRGVDDTAQSWVNDLPGLSTELVGDLSQPSDLLGDEDADPAKLVWESVHRNAFDRLLSESLLQLSENYDYQPVIARTQEPGLMPFGAISTSIPKQWIGVLLSALYTPNSVLTIRSASVLVNSLPYSAVDASVKIINLNTRAIIATVMHSFRVGVNKIEFTDVTLPVAFLQAPSIALIVDSALLSMSEFSPVSWNNTGLEYVITGVSSTWGNADTFVPEAAPCFVYVDAEISRSLDTQLHRYTADLRVAYGYLCGSILMTEKLATPNLSVFTLSNLQFTERLESKLFDDFKRALRPVVRRLSNDLQQQQALSVPAPVPTDYSISFGSYV